MKNHSIHTLLVILMAQSGGALGQIPQFHPDWKPDQGLKTGQNWQQIYQSAHGAAAFTTQDLLATIQAVQSQMASRASQLQLSSDQLTMAAGQAYDPVDLINRLRSTGHTQLLFEALSGVQLDWIEEELFKVMINYDPIQYPELERMMAVIKAADDGPKKTFLLDRIQRTMLRYLTEPEKLNLQMAYVGLQVVRHGLPADPKTRVDQLRMNPWHMNIMNQALTGGHKLTPAEVGRIAGYLSAVGDQEPADLLVKASQAMISNTDEYAYSWKPDIQNNHALQRFELDAGARYEPRKNWQWCVDHAVAVRGPVSSGDIEVGLYFQYDQKRLFDSETYTQDVSASTNGYASLGKRHKCFGPDGTDCRVSEGHYIRRAYLPTRLNIYDGQGQQVLMDVFAEYQIPRKETVQVGTGDAAEIQTIWHWDTQDYAWGKFTCNIQQKK